MSEQDIPQPVRAFIHEHIDSVMDLELLLLLNSAGGRSWTAADLAAELRVDPAWIAVEMNRLRASGLLSPVDAQPGAVIFNPATPGIRQTINDLAAAYADRRVTVISLIFSKPTDKIRSFADAFRIRRENTDG